MSGIVAGVLAPIGLLVSDRLFGGSLGLGDVKLSVSLGLLCGIYLLIAGFFVASIVFAIVIGVLIALRRLKLPLAHPVRADPHPRRRLRGPRALAADVARSSETRAPVANKSTLAAAHMTARLRFLPG